MNRGQENVSRGSLESYLGKLNARAMGWLSNIELQTD